jgi:hypothetical protein
VLAGTSLRLLGSRLPPLVRRPLKVGPSRLILQKRLISCVNAGGLTLLLFEIELSQSRTETGNISVCFGENSSPRLSESAKQPELGFRALLTQSGAQQLELVRV